MTTMTIDKNTTIKQLQQLFTAAYPFLRIEFFKKRHAQGKLSLKEDRADTQIRLSELGKLNAEVEINIEKKRTVTELEQDFEKIAGLYAQVLRKSGKSWIQTSLTDDWSLERQNREAEMLSVGHKAQPWEENVEAKGFYED